MNSSLKNYFFAGATAAVALALFLWLDGYSAGLGESASTQTQLLSADTASTISGQITDITDTVLTIVVPDSVPTTRRVFIDPATALMLKVLKDKETFRSDILAFDLKLKTAKANGVSLSPSEYPTPFAFQKISLADLHAGDMVTVTATGPIFNKGEFTAMSVIAESRSSQ